MDPSAREQGEALGGVGSLNDFERPLFFPDQALLELFTRVAAVGEDVALTWTIPL